MKPLGSLLNKKTLENRRQGIDQQTVFYILQSIIREEYGKQGAENVVPIGFHDRKIFAKTKREFWVQEIDFNKTYLLRRINDQLEGEEITDLVASV